MKFSFFKLSPFIPCGSHSGCPGTVSRKNPIILDESFTLRESSQFNKKSKPCIRALKTEFTEKIHEAGVMEMTDMMKIQDLYFGGDMNAAPALTGQSAGLIDTVKPVAQIIDETIDEFNEACKRMSAQKF